MPNNIRIEGGPLGIRGVPADAYYNVHILRAIENFYVSNSKISDVPEFVRGMVMVKKAAAMANKELQTIPKSVANAIIAACDEVLNNGKYIDQLPVGVYQDGAGTSVNININGVLANIGLELMGHQKGEYQYLDPNDHVNKYQSINDVYPAGFRAAACSSLIKLVDTISQLYEGFEHKAVRFQGILKAGCAQLQDVVPMTLGQEFRAFSILLEEEMKNVQRTVELLLKASLGATAIGTGLNTSREYSPLAMKKLAEITGPPCIPARDLIEAISDRGAYTTAHNALRCLAVKMSKICSDLRSLSSNPRTGLNEINLPELQAGPSIMPAKMSPVIPEMVDQACFKVAGNDTTVTMVAEAGQLQLNVMEPVIGQAMLESVYVLTNICYNLLEKCINGVTASREVYEGYTYSSTGIVTYLNPFIGHHGGDIVGKVYAETDENVREVVLERGLLAEAKFDDIFSVRNLVYLTYKAKCYTDESEQ